MKDLARLLAAAMLGAGVAVAGSALAQKSVPASGEVLALVATHIDTRFDRLEKGMDVLASRLADADRDIQNTDTDVHNVESDIQHACPHQ